MALQSPGGEQFRLRFAPCTWSFWPQPEWKEVKAALRFFARPRQKPSLAFVLRQEWVRFTSFALGSTVNQPSASGWRFVSKREFKRRTQSDFPLSPDEPTVSLEDAAHRGEADT